MIKKFQQVISNLQGQNRGVSGAPKALVLRSPFRLAEEQFATYEQPGAGYAYGGQQAPVGETRSLSKFGQQTQRWLPN